MSKEKTPQADPQDEVQAAPQEPEMVEYIATENGSTNGRSGRPFRYMTGNIIPAPAGELDHVGFKYRTRPLEPEA